MRDPTRTVWLVGPATYDTLAAVARAFARLGWQPTVRAYEFIRTPWQRWLWRVAPKLRWRSTLGFRPWLEARWYNRFLRDAVIPEVSAQPPALLVFVRPYQLEADTLQMLAKLGRPVVTWATDSLSRYGRFAGVWDFAVRNYVFDGGDLQGRQATWLPLGFDDELFLPAANREWDVLFVGRIYARLYWQRLLYFQLLVDSDLPGKCRVALVGSVVRQHAQLVRRFQERGGTCLGDLNLPGLAHAIARSKLAICVHQDDGCQPVNPMFFAIPGSRTCLVTDRRDYLSRWLQPEREFLPVGPEEFIPRIKALLENEPMRADLAECGHQAALRHTWVERVRTLLEVVRSVPGPVAG